MSAQLVTLPSIHLPSPPGDLSQSIYVVLAEASRCVDGAATSVDVSCGS